MVRKEQEKKKKKRRNRTLLSHYKRLHGLLMEIQRPRDAWPVDFSCSSDFTHENLLTETVPLTAQQCSITTHHRN